MASVQEPMPPLEALPRLLGREGHAEDELLRTVQEVFNKTHLRRWSHDRRRLAQKHKLSEEEQEHVPSQYKVLGVEAVGNKELTRLYQAFRAKVGAAVGQTDVWSALTTSLHGDFIRCKENEWILFHGTTEANARSIALHGYLPDHVQPGNLLGPLLYFTDSVTKADEYAAPTTQGGERWLVINRVFGGRVLHTEEVAPDPAKILSQLQAGEYHSVLNDREKKPRETFKEFAVLRPEQVEPLLLVRYKQVGLAPVSSRCRCSKCPKPPKQ